MRKVVSIMFLLVFLSMTVSTHAQAAAGSWQDMLNEYPQRPVELLEGNLDVYGRHDWKEALQDLSAQGMEHVRIFDAEGNELSLIEGTRICTGQHGCFFFSGYEGGVRLFDIVVHGDVLGTGRLNIAQVVRLAQAITGGMPLAGPYLLAGDINRNGALDISDLTKLVGWLTQEGPQSRNLSSEPAGRFPWPEGTGNGLLSQSRNA